MIQHEGKSLISRRGLVAQRFLPQARTHSAVFTPASLSTTYETGSSAFILPFTCLTLFCITTLLLLTFAPLLHLTLHSRTRDRHTGSLEFITSLKKLAEVHRGQGYASSVTSEAIAACSRSVHSSLSLLHWARLTQGSKQLPKR